MAKYMEVKMMVRVWTGEDEEDVIQDIKRGLNSWDVSVQEMGYEIIESPEKVEELDNKYGHDEEEYEE